MRSPSVRAFVAIEPDAEARRELTECQAELRTTGGDVRWQAPGTIHLTLQFLGNVPEERLDDLRAGLIKACGRHPPLVVDLKGLGAFPHLRRPRVVWAGCVGRVELLHALADDIIRSMTRLGCPADKPLRPHVTLGRLRSDQGVDLLREAIEERVDRPIAGFTASEVVLFRSEPGAGGARHTPLGQAALSG